MDFHEVAACCADKVSIDRGMLYYHSYILTPTRLFITSVNQSDPICSHAQFSNHVIRLTDYQLTA